MMDPEEFRESFESLTQFKRNRFHPLVWINGEPEIGENVYIGGMSEVNAKGAKVLIGDNCDIASFVSINCADSHKKCLELSEKTDCKDIVLEDHVFVGSHCVIKGGSHIGHHSVVAAGTIVDGVKIPPYSLISGNPMEIKDGYYLKNKREGGEFPHNKPALDREEKDAAAKVISSGWIAQGKEVEGFENEFCHFTGLPEGHAVAVSSGTAALFLALSTLNGKGKKVAFPVYACSALRNAVAMAYADEMLVDTGYCSPNIDLQALKSCRADIAIIPHMFGLPADISGFRDMLIIEDCAQALGASIGGVQVGLHGKIGIYSFSATKLMTSGGQGGMVVSKDKALVDAVRDYREFDQRNDKKKRFNFQMTDIQGSIGRVQLRKLPGFLKRRNEIYESYREAGLPLLDVSEGHISPVRYRAVVVTGTGQPEKIILVLSEAGIKAIIPVKDWELLGEKNIFANAFNLTQHTVSLPIYPLLSTPVVQKISAIVKDNL